MSTDMKDNKEVELTDKQKTFCKEYCIDLNATQAAIRAGYSEKSARQSAADNMAKPYIQDAIEAIMTVRSSRTQVSADFVVRNLVSVVNRCMESEPVTSQEGGEMAVLGEYKFNANGANKALELLGRHLGMFTDKIEHRGGVTFINDYGSPDTDS
jgi:phage terminase small subunit